MPNNTQPDDLIAVERYKFILDKIKYLDSLHQSHFAFISKAVIAIITFIIAVLLAGIEGKIKLDAVIFSIKSSGSILVIIGLFFLMMSWAILKSWEDYRNEEVALLDKIDSKIERKRPSNEGFWRWNETHFMFLLVGLIIVGVTIFFNPNWLTSILPPVVDGITKSTCI